MPQARALALAALSELAWLEPMLAPLPQELVRLALKPVLLGLKPPRLPAVLRVRKRVQ